MAVGCQMTRLRRLRLVGAVAVLALASAGCAARWAARQGNEASALGDWDLAVARFTRAADWTPVYAEPDPDRPAEAPGVYDVKSASELLSLAGTPYNEW